jgi:hypothetical protein
MASGPITPPPYADLKNLPNSFQMWYLRVKDYTNSIASAVIPWAQVDKSGSNLTDLTTRNHNDLTNIFGGGTADYYHLTASQYSSVVTLTTVSSLTTLGSSNGYVLCDATAGAFTVNLPAASTRKRYHIKKKDVTANAVTISAAGADTIEGSASKSLATQYKSYTLYSDGSTTWYIEAST